MRRLSALLVVGLMAGLFAADAQASCGKKKACPTPCPTTCATPVVYCEPCPPPPPVCVPQPQPCPPPAPACPPTPCVTKKKCGLLGGGGLFKRGVGHKSRTACAPAPQPCAVPVAYYAAPQQPVYAAPQTWAAPQQ